MAALIPGSLVIYVDSEILVVDKPAGLLSLQDGYDKNLPHLVKILAPEFGPLLTVHRLDRETSGVVVLARTVEAHRNLNIQFQKRTVEKIYHALVYGAPAWSEFRATFPLRKDGDRQHRTVIDHHLGKKALTDLLVIERFDGYTLIEAHPHTGYTHQIRAHLAFLGFPLVGDKLYRGRQTFSSDTEKDQHQETSSPIDRIALHACSITLNHPVSGDKVTFQSAYPPDFAAAIEKIRRLQKPDPGTVQLQKF